MSTEVDELTAIASAVRAIAHGDVYAPGGLEALAMSISGPGFGHSLAESIDNLAAVLDEGLTRLADAIAGQP